MVQQINSKQRLSPSPPAASIDTRSAKNTKLQRQTKRVATAKIVRGCIGKVFRKVRLVTRDVDTQSGSTTATSSTVQSPTISTEDGQRLIAVLDTSESPSHRHAHRIKSPSPLSASDDLLIGEAYHIFPEVTGHGIAGEVRECIQRSTGELCAVKTICKNRIRRKDRIDREVAFLKEVNHPNIISLHDVYEDEDDVNLVMEICRGGELFDKIVEKSSASKLSRERNANQRVPSCFRERDAARVVHSLLSAVSYLHSKDIVHRDIKPENILFVEKDDDESPIKLIDFGLSIRHPRQCAPLTTTVGTSYYMAPELLEGSYDRSCDLWSVGVVAYTILSGRPPFNGPSDDVIFKKILRGLDRYKMETSSLWDGVSGYAKDFIRCLLDMDPERRWTADMALEHPWLKVARLEAQSESTTARASF